MTDRETMQQALEAAPLSDYSKADGDFYKWWYSHMQNDLMQPPLNEVGYRVARYIWDAALRSRLAQPEQEPVACQYAKDVAMPEYRCVGKCQYAQPEQEQWDAIPDAFNEWWDADYDDTGNPYRKDSPAYWAWSGWKAASKQPEQKPVAWGCNRYIKDDNGFQIGTDEPELAWGKFAPDDNGWWPLYTSPPQRKPLTDEEIERACVPLGAAMLSFTEVARAIEAAHGIKENT